jgi:hypothetical protein
MEVLHSGYNSSVDVSQLDSILSSLQPLDFVILVVNPQEARDIWSVSFSQVVLKLKSAFLVIESDEMLPETTLVIHLIVLEWFCGINRKVWSFHGGTLVLIM